LLPEFLKGADETLYASLVETFDLKLVPIVLTSHSGVRGNWNDYSADPVKNLQDVDAAVNDSKKLNVIDPVKVTYITTGLEKLIQLETVEYIEDSEG
jgi:hypothetical protein